MAATEKGETVAVNLGALLDAGAGAMVTLVAGDTELVAHRAVLSARSPTFAAMFCCKRHGQLTITDVQGPVLRELVSYLYTPQAPQLPDTLPQLLAAADSYGVRGLKADCERQMVARLTVENAASTAVLAVRHDCPDLQRAAVAFVKAHSREVMATRDWADAMLDPPRELLPVTRLVGGMPMEPGSTATDGQSHSEAPEAAATPTTPSGGDHSSQTQFDGTQGYSQSNHITNSVDGAPPRSPSGGNSGCQVLSDGTQGYSQSNHITNSVDGAPPRSPSGGNSGCQLLSGGTQGYSQSNHSTNPVDDAPPRSPSGGNSGCQLLDAAAESRKRKAAASPPEEAAGVVKKPRLVDTTNGDATFMSRYMGMFNAMLHVFEYLTVQELLHASRVCRLWRSIAQHESLWQTVRMKNLPVSDWKGCEATLAKRGTRHLDMREMPVPAGRAEDWWAAFCASVGRVECLEAIELCRCPADVVLRVARQCPQLKALSAISLE